MLIPKVLYWTRIINFIINNYLLDTTICILWNDEIEFELLPRTYNSPVYTIINISSKNLTQSFKSNVVDFTAKHEHLLRNGVTFNELVEKLTMSIESSHCESFLAFQADIPAFAEAFTNASKYSIWRSTRNRFVFAFRSDLAEQNYFHHHFFKDQYRILVIESADSKLHHFDLKTNKFVGPRAQNPAGLYLLDHFDAKKDTFKFGRNLFPDKTRDLQGREVVLAAFDYRPALVLKYDTYKNVRNLDLSDPIKKFALLDGTEGQPLLTFCEKYNCTVEIDTSETDDWGIIYPNKSGDGALGMITKRKAEIALGAMYTWYEPYAALDMSVYVSRSGITCLVPVPRRLTSWYLPLEPFPWNLWGAVMACLCVEVIGLMFMRHFQQMFNAEANCWKSNFLFSCITTLKLIISQPISEDARSTSLRLFLLACFMNDIIITSIYDGGLASILTIPSFQEAADSFERLQYLNLKWAANSEAWVSTIREDPKMVNILKNFFIYTNTELRQMAKTENMGFTVERLPFGHFAVAEYITPEVIARYKIMQDDIYFQYTVTFVPRLWPLLERYDKLLYMWHSSGFDKYSEWRVAAEYLNSNVQKQIEASMLANSADIGPVKLGMSNFAGMLLLWFLGIISAMLALCIELVFDQFHQNA